MRVAQFLVVALVLCRLVAGTAVSVPCSKDHLIIVVNSTTHYTLLDCTLPDDEVDPFVYFIPSPGIDVVQNISVAVIGGNVLPFFVIAPPTHDAFNITVTIRDAHVGPFVFRPSTPKHQNRAIFCSTNGTNVDSVTVAIIDSIVEIAMAPTLVASGSLLFFAQNASVGNVVMTLSNSSFSVSLAGPVSFYATYFVYLRISTILLNMTIELLSSALVLHVNQTEVNGTSDAGIFSVKCLGDIDCDASNVAMISNGSTVSTQHVGIAGDPSGVENIHTTKLVSFYIRRLLDLRIVLVRTAVVSGSTCAHSCVAQGSAFFSYFLIVDGGLASTNLKSLVFNASDTTFAVEAPSTAGIVRIVHLKTSAEVMIALTSSSAVVSAFGSPEVFQRDVFVVSMQSATLTGVAVVVDGMRLDASAEGGGASTVTAMMINVAGTLTNASIHVRNATFLSSIANGTMVADGSFPAGLFAFLTMYTCLVNVASTTGDAKGLMIVVVNVSVRSHHSTSAPPLVLTTFAISLIAGVSASLSSSGSTMHLAGVEVVRDNPPWAASGIGLVQRATGVILLADMYAGVPLALRTAMGLATSNVTHSLATIRLTSQCAVGYAAPMAVPATDLVALLSLPSCLVLSHVAIVDVALFRGRSDVAAGAMLVARGGALVQDSSIDIQRVPSGSAALISVDSGNLTLLGGTSVSLVLAQIIALPSTANTSTPLGLGDGTIVFGGGAFVATDRCEFNGFHGSMLRASMLRATGVGAVLRLGCNLWNHQPLPARFIGYNAELRPHIVYTPAAFNSSVTCPGFPSISTTAPIEIDHAPQKYASIGVASVESTVAGLVYVTLLPNMLGRGAVPGLQRSLAVLRLSSRCASTLYQGPNEEDDSSHLSAQEPPMLSQLFDNPLALQVPVASETLRYAAGAVLGNTILVVIVAATLHALDSLHRVKSFGQRGTAVLQVLPSCPLPGAAAGVFARLVQPSVCAAFALLVSTERTPESIICGLAMLLLWLSYPAYCSVVVLWRGYHRGVFVLQTELVCTPTTGMGRAHVWATQAVRETQEWVPHRGLRRGTPERDHASFLLDKMEAVFGGFVVHREWYFLVEWAAAGVSGAVLGAAEAIAVSNPENACDVASWGIASATALGTLQLAACLWCRPYNVRLELWMALIFGGLELLSNALVLGGLDDDASGVVTASSVTELATVVLVHLLLSFIGQQQSCSAATAASTPPLDTVPRNNRTATPSRAATERVARRKSAQTKKVSAPAEQLRKLVELICTPRGTYPHNT